MTDTLNLIHESRDLDERLRLLADARAEPGWGRAVQETRLKLQFARACWRAQRLHIAARLLHRRGKGKTGAACAVRSVEEASFAKGMWVCELFPSWVGEAYRGSDWYKPGDLARFEAAMAADQKAATDD